MPEQPTSASSPELTERLRRFRSRSGEVLEHPLASVVSDITVTFKADKETGQIVDADFNPNAQDRTSWVYLATLLRPLVFLTNDEGSVGQLMNLIQRDHPALRDCGIRAIQKGLNDWRTTSLIGITDLGTAEQVPDQRGNVTSVWTGEPGTMPAGLDPAAVTPDYELADIYFNGRLWHADAHKVDLFDSAVPLMQILMAKCAEVRTLSAVQWVRHLHDWIDDARAAGWPL